MSRSVIHTKYDLEQDGIDKLTFSSIVKCDVDIRKNFFNNTIYPCTKSFSNPVFACFRFRLVGGTSIFDILHAWNNIEVLVEWRWMIFHHQHFFEDSEPKFAVFEGFGSPHSFGGNCGTGRRDTARGRGRRFDGHRAH